MTFKPGDIVAYHNPHYPTERICFVTAHAHGECWGHWQDGPGDWTRCRFFITDDDPTLHRIEDDAELLADFAAWKLSQ